MQQEKQVLAFDMGASGGRVMLGRFNGRRIEIEEVHRFSNDPVMVGDTLFWDVLRLLHEVKQGFVRAKSFGKVDSFGIDTWGVDFGLIDKKGRLIENPVHYRDGRTAGMMEKVFEIIPKERLYSRTGIQFMNLNTLFQLYSLKLGRPEMLDMADKMLLMPDLLLYMLTGVRNSEYTISSTGQMIDPYRRDWDKELLETLGLPTRILCPIVHPGGIRGMLSGPVCSELGIEPIPAANVASHDTASAVAAVPSEKQDFIYLSSGTWSLMGIESREPLIDDMIRGYNFTNEGGFGKTTRFLKNIMGLWMIQESRRQWIREGEDVSYAGLEKEAAGCEPFKCLIDPDSELLLAPGDMPERIRELCRISSQQIPEKRGEVVRCIYESLALKYRLTKENIEKVSGRKYPEIHIVGGGSRDGLLSQFTANAAGCEVTAGPSEATALGNIAVQLSALGCIKDIWEMRSVISGSVELKRYRPRDQEAWENAVKRYKRMYPEA